jgi:hypothetical protein
MTLRLVPFVVLALFAIPVVLCAQAAVEYALKSGSGAVAANAGSSIAGCKVDAALLSCLNHSYPRMMIVIAVVVCLLIVRWLAGHTGYRAH